MCLISVEFMYGWNSRFESSERFRHLVAKSLIFRSVADVLVI